MEIREPTTLVPLSKRELSLIKEMADDFMRTFAEATDVVLLAEKVESYYRGDFE